MRREAHVAASTEPIAIPLEREGVPLACGVVDDGSFTLLWLGVPPLLRGRGIGSRLLRGVAAWCVAHGVARIETDDMSDRARQRGNIYLSHGFVYADEDGGPEMYADAATVAAGGGERDVPTVALAD